MVSPNLLALVLLRNGEAIRVGEKKMSRGFKISVCVVLMVFAGLFSYSIVSTAIINHRFERDQKEWNVRVNGVVQSEFQKCSETGAE